MTHDEIDAMISSIASGKFTNTNKVTIDIMLSALAQKILWLEQEIANSRWSEEGML